VTAALSHLEDIGAIAKSRGVITVLNRRLLERHACECYRIIVGEYARHVDVPLADEGGRARHRTGLVPSFEPLDYTGA
jgi:hypothetical protein